MTVEEYLKGAPKVELAYIAEKMFPGNKNPRVQMSMKLKGVRPFTRKDSENALAAIKELVKELNELTLD